MSDPTAVQQADPATEIRAAVTICRDVADVDPDEDTALPLALADLLEAHAASFDNLAKQHESYTEFDPKRDWRTYPLPSPAEQAALKLARAITAADESETAR